MSLTNFLQTLKTANHSSLKLVPRLHKSLKQSIRQLFRKLFTQHKHSPKISFRYALYNCLQGFEPTAQGNMGQQTPLYSTRRRSLILSHLRPCDSFLESLQQGLQHTQNSSPYKKNTLRRRARSAALLWQGRTRPQNGGVSQSQATSAHAKATWAS